MKEKDTQKIIDLEKQLCEIKKKNRSLALDFTSQIESHKSEKNLKRLDETEQLANCGTWEFNFKDNTIWCSKQTRRILELNQKENKISREYWLSKIFPSDKEMAVLSYQKSISNKIPFEIEYRLLTKNNTIKYVKLKCNTYYSKKGKPLKSFGIVMDITILKENELLLKKSSRNKVKLMSILAHDLRSPFNKIIGFTGLLIENMKDNNITESKKYANIIYSSSQKTLDLLDSLLNWVRFQTTEITFNPDLLSLLDVIDDVLELKKLLAEYKGISLNYFSTEDLEVYADENMLKIIIRNLISNAIKFTNSGGAIRIDSFLRKDGIEISISDTGIGIEPEIIKNIFTNHSYSSTLGTQNEKGTGKGLAICKEFIDRHQGEIWAESVLRKSSKFKIILPNKKLTP
jgi:nitrogen-specific signal transduction histidine kinase